MRTINVIFIIIFFLGDVSAQKEDFTWELGGRWGEVYGTEMDFNTQPVTVRNRYGGPSFTFNASCTAISDKNGNLLFYSDGIRIYTREHEIMENGDTLNPTDATLYNINTYPGHGSSIKQNMLILPWPKKDSIYFLLHHGLPFHLWKHKDFTINYSVVDMHKNDGYGKVISKNNALRTDTLARGRLTACRHANGRDWWILIRKADSIPGYHRYLLDPEGLEYKGVQIIGNTIIGAGGGRGQAVFSPDGKHYAFLTYYWGSEPYRLDLYDFDRCTGLLSNHKRLIYNSETEGLSGYGIAFSPNGKFLYASTTNYVYQYNVYASDIEQSRKQVGEMGLYYCENQELIFGFMQLAPDGKIYIAGEDFCSLSEIRYPDKKGTASGVVPNALEMKTWNTWCLPDFPVYRLGPLDGSPCDTLGIERPPIARFRIDSLYPYQMGCTDISWFHPTGWQWSFGDGTTDTMQHPDHTYQDTGTYEICLTVINEDGEDTTCDTVHITDQSTGIHVPDRPELNIYPVPSDDYITIEGLAKNTILNVYNIRGEIVDRVEHAGPQVRYRIDHLPPGIYWIKSQAQIGKFIRQ